MKHEIEYRLIQRHNEKKEFDISMEKKRGLNMLPQGLFSKEAERILKGEIPEYTAAGPKVSFLQYQPVWQDEKVGDYIGKKIPSLLEFLENKINLNELT